MGRLRRPHVVIHVFVILRALTRTQYTQKHVQKNELRRSRNVYEAIEIVKASRPTL